MRVPLLVSALEYELSRPPAKAGMRLLSEHLLAEIFQVHRMKMHRALDQLVEKGILSRRHGSGTFIRKIPLLPMRPTNYKFRQCSLFPTEQTRGQAFKPLQPCGDQHCIRLALWSDLDCTTYANQMLLDGIKTHVQTLGHQLEIHRLLHGHQWELTVDEIAEQIRASNCDAAMVGYVYAEKFEAAYQRVWGDKPLPVIYISAGSSNIDYEPLIQADTQNAIERGVRHLAKNGYQHIGLINISDGRNQNCLDDLIQTNTFAETQNRHLAAYRFTLSNAHLQPREVLNAAGDNIDVAHEQIEKWLDKQLHHQQSKQASLDAICLSSEDLLWPLMNILNKRGLEPGRDLGIVSISNEKSKLPQGINWSCLEFSPSRMGVIAIDSLVQMVATAGSSLQSFSHQAQWKPGVTHLRQCNKSDMKVSIDHSLLLNKEFEK